MTIKAAGILFLCDDKVLFVRRSNNDTTAPGVWAFPGGKIEPGESAVQAAVREVSEETGRIVAPDMPVIWTRTLSGTVPATGEVVEATGAPEEVTPAASDPALEPVDFTTFLVKCDEQFFPELCEEHDGFAWAPVASPPEPLHPGVRVALDRFSMNELDVAEAMVEGRLASPQRYENVWLFAMRITGTGVIYRSGRKEFVLRDPSIYCHERFLKRCNGLQVIWEHPDKGQLLDDEQFKDRTIGAIFLPYLRPDKSDEVWGIAKVYDDEAAQEMIDNRLSTSPAVNFSDPSVNSRVEIDGGDKLLIEGDPSLLDHLAVCANGVWDKGGPAAGIESMADSNTLVIADVQKIEQAPSSPLCTNDVNMLYAQAAAFGLKAKMICR